MKKLISILVILVITAVAQPPVITQIGSFIVGPTLAIDIKLWGDDFIVSRYSYEAGSSVPYNPELILLNKFGAVIWNKIFSPRELGSRKNLIITSSNLFCIFTLGDTIYKINKAGEILKKKFLNSTIVEIKLQPDGEIIVMEVNMASIPSRFFIYNENLDLVRVIVSQPGATYSVVQQGSSYLLSGNKYGGGVNTNISSHIARYDTASNLLWLRQFPDVMEMRLVVNCERVYFCGIDISSWYSRLIYGEVSQYSGDTLWTKTWGAPYPESYMTVVDLQQIMPSPDGGFVAVGSSTTPGQLGNYDPNNKSGLILGYSPRFDQPWLKYSDRGTLYAATWNGDTSLLVFGNLGMFPTVAKVIIYSVSGLTAIEDETGMPQGFSLSQNYPNPFNPETKIQFSLSKTGSASLKVYDLLGREVSVLVDQELAAGAYEISFDASALASGLYVYTLSVDGQTASKKMALLR